MDILVKEKFGGNFSNKFDDMKYVEFDYTERIDHNRFKKLANNNSKAIIDDDSSNSDHESNQEDLEEIQNNNKISKSISKESSSNNQSSSKDSNDKKETMNISGSNRKEFVFDKMCGDLQIQSQFYLILNLVVLYKKATIAIVIMIIWL